MTIMSNVLKVSTPIPGYENNTRSNPVSTGDTNISNVTDVSKVTRTDGQSPNADYQENKFPFPGNSNFEGFAKNLRNMPTVTEMMTDLLFVQMGNMVQSGINEDFAEEISAFLQMIKVSEGDLQSFMKNQVQSDAKFQGPFFELLRKAMSQTNSKDLINGILDFCKKYNDFTSNRHVLNLIFTDITNISKFMPSRFGESLAEIANALDQNAAQGDVEKNNQVLKKEIIPYLSKYIKGTNDFGKVRDLITSLTLNIARYENGSKEGFFGAFQGLMGYNMIKEKFGDIDADQLIQILMELDAKKAENNPLQDKFVSLLENGIKGDAGYENIDTFRGILSSVLINESVYMPLLHVMLPLNVDGNMMFSEVWIDPDDKSGGGKSEDGKREKCLVKFDIKEVGFFDLVIVHDNGKVDLQIFCPEKIMEVEKGIYTSLTEIIAQNGLSVRSVSVKRGQKPVLLSEVFPKIYERKNAINVRI